MRYHATVPSPEGPADPPKPPFNLLQPKGLFAEAIFYVFCG